MKDRPARPDIEFEVGDEYQIFTHQEGNVLYRYIPRQPDWWDEADEEQRKSVLDYFDSDDVFTLNLEIAGFMAVDKPDVEDVARLVRNHWALSWMIGVAALADDPFTQEHIVLRKTVGHHRLVAMAKIGARAGYNILNKLPKVLQRQAGNLAESSPYDVIKLEDEE